MTVWDNIYKKYKQNGEVYATLRDGLNPEFMEFMQVREASYDFQAKRALDIGCGNGKYLVFLKSLGFETSGIDSSPTAVEMTKEALGDNSDIRCLDMYEYQLPVARYDLIISISAIHHGPRKQVGALIKRLYPALLPGGRFFITLPDNEGSSHWTMMTDSEEIEPGTRVPLSGPEAGVPHSAFTRAEIKDLFSEYKTLDIKLLADRGRWIVSGEK